MHAVILAAGEGSRMGDRTDDVPKAFMEVAGRTLYDRQREAVDPHVDGVTLVLGYRHENVEDRVDRARTVVVDRWDEFDNAESLHRALLDVDDDVLVLNGDVVVAQAAVSRLVRAFEAAPDHGVVGHLPGVQSEHTAVRLDADGRVVEYGDITGYRHAGVGVLDRRHLGAATDHLADHRAEWYPSVYEAVPTLGVVLPPEQHLEINRPRDLPSMEGQLPDP